MLPIFVDVPEAPESRINVFNGIMDVLEDDSVSLIGVHGMAGIGKSRLIKEVATKVKEDKFFDAVVSVVVTKTTENKNIQDQIAEQLGSKFYGQEENRRVYQLFQEMKRMRKILVILDDIRVRLDLDAIGIPYGHHHEGCKILLASRSLNLLCEMNTQKNVSVGVLEPEAAWDLFKKIGGDGVDESPDLQSTAVEVAKECGGLPIAISTVARALRNKSSMEWRAALQKLKRPSKNKRALEVLQSAVKLSYDHLRSEELKFAFVLCCLMGNNAAIEDFLKYGMGLGLFNGIKTMEEARDKALALVLELKESFLLLDSYTDKLFDVHDTVRDFAISIASENHHLFIVKDEAVIKDWSDEKKIEGSNVIVLQNANIGDLPSRLNCPQLKFFYLGSKYPSWKFPTGFFKETQELEVLHLNNVIFSSLPSSIRVLANLSTLCLHDCFMEDIKIIEELRNLEILSLSGSDIEKLPREIGNLTRLRLLDLNNCTNLKYIPPRTLSSLSRLEELYMRNRFFQWEIEGDGRNASLAELKELCHLTSLDIEIPDVKMMPKDLFSGRLSRYRIVIGYVWDRMHKIESSRTVKLDGYNLSYHLGDGFKGLLNQTEGLYLGGLRSKKVVRCLFEGQSFQHLKNLHLEFSKKIQYLVNPMDWTHHEAFPILESLSLVCLHDLKNICHGTPEVKLFDRLRIVKVAECYSLKNLFSLSIFRNLFQLQEIEVVDCKNIIELVADEREEFEENPIICNIQSLKLQRLPKLISFSIQQLTYTLPLTFEALFNEKIMFPCLEDLQLYKINIGRIWQNQLATTSCCGQNLRSLIIERCDDLKYLLSHSAAGCLVQLKLLRIISCKGMGEIIEAEEKPEEITEAKILFPQLHSLWMENLPKLRGFYFGNSIIEFPNLKEVIVKKCPNLEMFSHGVLTPKLQNVKTSGEGRRIWAEDLNTTIQQLYKEQLIKRKDETESETESEDELNVEAGASGTQGEEAEQGKAILSDKIVETSPATRQGIAAPRTGQKIAGRTRQGIAAAPRTGQEIGGRTRQGIAAAPRKRQEITPRPVPHEIAQRLERAESALRAHSSSVRGSRGQATAPEDNASKTEKLQAFVKEEVLVGIYNDVFPCTAEQFYNLLFSDDSSFTNEYRSARKDKNLTMGQWHAADEYDGQVREITFRSICNSPMCPPDTAMTEYQHSVLSSDKKKLVFETVQQAHDVPFGSYFEVHCRWSAETNGENSSVLDIKVGAHFNKWCVMQSKIRSGVIDEYKKEVELMLDVARSYIKSHTTGGETNNSSSSPSVTQDIS